MKPFDLAAAKAGAKFFYFSSSDDGKRLACSFIGFRANGSVVFEELCTDRISWAPAENLRMLPQKVRKAVNIWRRGGGELYIGYGLFDTFLTAKAAAISNLAESGTSEQQQYCGTTYIEYEE